MKKRYPNNNLLWETYSVWDWNLEKRYQRGWRKTKRTVYLKHEKLFQFHIFVSFFFLHLIHEMEKEFLSILLMIGWKLRVTTPYQRFEHLWSDALRQNQKSFFRIENQQGSVLGVKKFQDTGSLHALFYIIIYFIRIFMMKLAEKLRMS